VSLPFLRNGLRKLSLFSPRASQILFLRRPSLSLRIRGVICVFFCSLLFPAPRPSRDYKLFCDSSLLACHYPKKPSTIFPTSVPFPSFIFSPPTAPFHPLLRLAPQFKSASFLCGYLFSFQYMTLFLTPIFLLVFPRHPRPFEGSRVKRERFLSLNARRHFLLHAEPGLLDS